LNSGLAVVAVQAPAVANMHKWVVVQEHMLVKLFE
jgi:hypothetical protein